MYCKLCGKHLYETITFTNLFRWNYQMHVKCEASFHVQKDYVVVPMLDQLVYYDFLFPRGSNRADRDYLYTRYMGDWLPKALKNQDWSILILLDDITDEGDLSLVVQLGSGTVIMLAMFDEETFGKTS